MYTYYPSLYKLVDAAYPECMYPWELINSEIPSGTWEDKNNRVLAITWLVGKLRNDTKKINRKTFSQYGLSALLENYYCDNPKRAIKEVI
ncbi:hypothetical protein [Clostridium rhizosphaerae]|uniref:hypothetical protein n=1 Tax=Clostridium rhizosphaerae TaxID=2803861 RepID=UPI00192AD901|nr:hypothetical protein [Clostridium rhizosphaerae]